VIYAAGAGDRLGRSAAVGDVNGDGLADALIAAPGGDGPKGSESNVGEVYVVYGSRSPPAEIDLGGGGAEAVAVIVGLDAADTLGNEVLGRPALAVSDVDGSGAGDVLVAAPGGDGPDNSRTDCGEGYVLFGGSSR